MFRLINVLVALGLLFGAFLIWGDGLVRVFTGPNPSGLVIGGRPLTNEETRDGMRELSGMLRGGKFGDPSSIETSGEPTTELGRTFRFLLARSQEVQATYVREIGGRQVTEMLDEARLTTVQGRARSREELAGWRKITKTYCDDSRDVQQTAISMFTGSSGHGIDRFFEISRGLTEIEAAMTRVYDVVGELLDLVDRAKPVVQGGQIAFRATADAKTYNALIRRFNLETVKAQKLSPLNEPGRQERFERSIERMGG